MCNSLVLVLDSNGNFDVTFKRYAYIYGSYNLLKFQLLGLI